MRSEKSAGRRDGLTGQTGSNLLGRLKLPIMTRQAHRRPLATLEVPRYLGRLMQWGPAEQLGGVPRPPPGSSVQYYCAG